MNSEPYFFDLTHFHFSHIADKIYVMKIAPNTNLHLGTSPNHDPANQIKISVERVNSWYGEKQALRDISLEIHEKEVIAFVGPSGCGKTTLLRCLNRTNEIITDTRIEGCIRLDGEDIYGEDIDPPVLRRRFGWIAQKPDPFPWSIRTNILYGAEIQGIVSHRDEKNALVEEVLTSVGLWDEVKDRLDNDGTDLSIGQQQRLCIARALATRPEVILMDEPCSALDPIATALIEELVDHLRSDYTIVIITHNMQQAARIAQRTAFFHLGNLVEFGDTEQIFLRPETEQCSNFITGRYG
jgi:phosphate transport system ATP-binding protein